jgi:hypothetical protein
VLPKGTVPMGFTINLGGVPALPRRIGEDFGCVVF